MKILVNKSLLVAMAALVSLTVACGGGSGGGGGKSSTKASKENPPAAGAGVEERLDYMDSMVTQMTEKGYLESSDSGVYLVSGLTDEQLSDLAVNLQIIVKVGDSILDDTAVSAPAEFSRQGFAEAMEQLRAVQSQVASQRSH